MPNERYRLWSLPPHGLAIEHERGARAIGIVYRSAGRVLAGKFRAADLRGQFLIPGRARLRNVATCFLNPACTVEGKAEKILKRILEKA